MFLKGPDDKLERRIGLQFGQIRTDLHASNVVFRNEFPDLSNVYTATAVM